MFLYDRDPLGGQRMKETRKTRIWEERNVSGNKWGGALMQKSERRRKKCANVRRKIAASWKNIFLGEKRHFSATERGEREREREEEEEEEKRPRFRWQNENFVHFFISLHSVVWQKMMRPPGKDFFLLVVSRRRESNKNPKNAPQILLGPLSYTIYSCFHFPFFWIYFLEPYFSAIVHWETRIFLSTGVRALKRTQLWPEYLKLQRFSSSLNVVRKRSFRGIKLWINWLGDLRQPVDGRTLACLLVTQR